MALPGTEITVSKEFNYTPARMSIRLVAGFERDRLVYWAVEKNTNGNPEHELFGVSQYGVANDAFKNAVQPYL
jgi:hypothetical protein